MERASPALAGGFYYHLTEHEVRKKKKKKIFQSATKTLNSPPGKTVIKNKHLPVAQW